MNEQSLYRQDAAADGVNVPPTLWRAFAGYGLWAVCFTVLYTGHALACTWMLTADNGSPWLSAATVTGVLAGIWLAFVFYLVVMSVRSGMRLRAVKPEAQRRSLRFMVALTFIADVTAVVVIFISGLPIIMTDVCV